MSKTKNTKAFFNTEIPGDWDVKHFEDVADIDRDSLNGSTPKDYEFDYISLSDVDSDDFKIETTRQVFASAPSRARRIVKQGDILMSTVRPNLQGFSLIRNEVKDLIASTGFAVITSNKCSNEFLFQFLFSSGIERQFYQLLVGSNYPAINSSDVRKLKIPLPPLPEQKAIAQVLSTADAAIHTTEKLIAQKELRKKWLMQQLLTGKKRLMGFDGEWREVKLGKVIEICSSKRVLEEDWKTVGIPFYRTREIIKLSNGEELKSPIFISESLFEELKSKYGVPKPNDILVTGVGTIGETYIVKVEDEFYFKDGNVIWFKMNEKINSSFLSQLFKTVYVRKQLLDNASITTVATFTIEGAKNTKIYLPSIEEQTTIAQVLQAADKEISLLKAKAEKLREQKKGLMQQLLTGKVRLKIN